MSNNNTLFSWTDPHTNILPSFVNIRKDGKSIVFTCRDKAGKTVDVRIPEDAFDEFLRSQERD